MTARATPSRRRSISSAPARSPRATRPTPGTCTCSSATRKRPSTHRLADAGAARARVRRQRRARPRRPARSSFSSVFPSGASAPLAITLDFDAATRQQAGAFTVGAIDQDGIASAKLSDVSIGEDGLDLRHLLRRHRPGARQAADRQFLQPAGPAPARRRALDGDRQLAARRSSARPARTPSAGSSPARSSAPMSTSPRSWSR